MSTHRERLDIYELTIKEIKDMVRTNIVNTIACWDAGRNVKKQTFHIIGEAGVGKTESTYQLAEELTAATGKEFSVIKIQSPVLSRDDLLCPFPVAKTGKFRMLTSDFIPTEEDQGSYGLFVIDEMSRGDHNLQQLMWQVMNEQMIHTYKFPKGWFILCLDNPDDEGYSMNYIEDSAGLRRACHVYCGCSVEAWLSHARKMAFHPLVQAFIESNPDKLYDHEAKKLGRIFANPASWERVSDIIWGYDQIGDSGITSNLNKIEAIVGGLLNASMTRYFIDFVTDNTKAIDPADIFFKYDDVRPKIKLMMGDSNNPRLAGLTTSFVEWLCQKRTPIDDITEDNLTNTINFLTDLPIDVACMFFAIQAERHASNQDEFIYLIDFNSKLRMNERFITEIENPHIEITKEALKRKEETSKKS